MANFGIKISQEGINIFDASPKDISFSSQYDSLKVLRTGTLTVELPGETLEDESVIRTDSYTHSLGYIPFFLPLAKGVEYPEALSATTDFIVNDTVETDIPMGAYSPNAETETARVYATSTTLVLEVNRSTMLIGIPTTYGARDVIVYYTIFYNRVDEEISL